MKTMRFLSSVILAGLAGCSPVLSHRGRPSSDAGMAVLQQSSNRLIYVSKVDERRILRNDGGSYELSPGVHSISLRFNVKQTQMVIPHAQEFDLSFDAKQGRKYRVEFKNNEDGSKWSAWILDVTDGQRVSSIITDRD